MQPGMAREENNQMQLGAWGEETKHNLGVGRKKQNAAWVGRNSRDGEGGHCSNNHLCCMHRVPPNLRPDLAAHAPSTL